MNSEEALHLRPVAAVSMVDKALREIYETLFGDVGEESGTRILHESTLILINSRPAKK